MNKPRIFLGSSGKQGKLLQAITRGLKDIADVEPWTTTFNPGRSTLDRLREHGAQLVDEVVQYEDVYRLCYVRGPEGILIGLAEQIG